MKFGLVLVLLLPLLAAAEEPGSWSWGRDSSKAPPEEEKEEAPVPDVVGDDFEVSGKEVRGDGEAEGRFLGDLGDKLCRLGLGVNCKKGYPAAVNTHYGPPHPHPKPVYGAPPPHPKPVYGAPPPHPKPVYGAPPPHPKPVYGAPPHHPHPPKPVYTAPHHPHHSKPVYKPPVPKPVYSAPLPPHQPKPVYTAPSPVSHPKPVYGPPPVYTPPKPVYTAPVKPSVVQHVHTHTHIHQGPVAHPPAGGSAVGGQAHVGGGFVPTSQGTQQSGVFLQPAYREDCQCVPQQFCRVQNVVPRSPNFDIRNIVDARTRGSDILSNATDVQEEKGKNVTTIVSPAEEKQISAVDLEEEPEEKETRHRRDLPQKEGTLSHKVTAATDIQERQLRGYRPGSSGCGSNLVCCRRPEFLATATQPSYTCGRGHSGSIQGRVKTPYYENGNTQFGEYPWQVALLRYDHGELIYVCGGVLIDPQHVLTAAHCIAELTAAQIVVRLGDWDVSAPTEFYQHVEIPASALYIHPNYYSGNLVNDVALIRMQRAVNFGANPHIAPVCLPDRYVDFTGHRCYVTGWGKDAFEETGNFQTILQEVDMPVVGHYQCQQALRTTRLGPSFRLAEGSLCAGGEAGRDACKGDGGSPLVCRGSDGAFQLAGLVSWGIGCGEPGIPGVYVDVPHYLSWIEAMTVY